MFYVERIVWMKIFFFSKKNIFSAWLLYNPTTNPAHWLSLHFPLLCCIFVLFTSCLLCMNCTPCLARKKTLPCTYKNVYSSFLNTGYFQNKMVDKLHSWWNQSCYVIMWINQQWWRWLSALCRRTGLLLFPMLRSDNVLLFMVEVL